MPTRPPPARPGAAAPPPPLTATSGSDGVFTFTPPTSNYTLSATRSGYYPSATSAPFRFDGSITWTQNVCMDAQPTATISPTFQVRNSVPAPVGGATLSVYNTARLITSAPALVFTNTTNATTGNSLPSLWSDTFEVRVFANGYAPFVQNRTIWS